MAAKNTDTGPLEYTKLYYSISEVAKLTGVKAHVLRYWESEFPSLKPRKTRTGSRRYRPVDIDEVLGIKKLLYVEGFKIAGARKLLRKTRSGKARTESAAPSQMALNFAGMDDGQKLAFLKDELRELLAMIKALEDKTGAKREMKGKG